MHFACFNSINLNKLYSIKDTIKIEPRNGLQKFDLHIIHIEEQNKKSINDIGNSNLPFYNLIYYLNNYLTRELFTVYYLNDNSETNSSKIASKIKNQILIAK